MSAEVTWRIVGVVWEAWVSGEDRPRGSVIPIDDLVDRKWWQVSYRGEPMAERFISEKAAREALLRRIDAALPSRAGW